MLYVLLIIAVAGTILAAGALNRRRIFRARAKSILKRGMQERVYAATKELPVLPQPVACYLKTVLPEDLPVLHNARLRHVGYFRTGLDKDWEAIKGVQYISGAEAGFVWKGQTRLFTAIDSYIAGRGNLSVWLFSVLRIVNKSDSSTDDAEIIRWLAENALVPSNLMPSRNLKWEAVDAATARLKYSMQEKEFSLLVRFNDRSEIEAVETLRPFGDGSMQKWKGRFGNYKQVGGFKVPTELEASWIINNLEKPYARFSITKIEFNCNHLFSDK